MLIMLAFVLAKPPNYYYTASAYLPARLVYHGCSTASAYKDSSGFRLLSQKAFLQNLLIER